MYDKCSITPPHHPAYNVNLTDEAISAILYQCILPQPARIEISKIPHGRSFNNRIYMVRTELKEYVLKVNGRFFGPTKIENEVACLLLLGHFCPSIPVPRVIAWSKDGSIVRGVVDGIPSESMCELKPRSEKTPGWILMSRVPGEPVVTAQLSATEQADIAAQLADIILLWRQSIPSSAGAGNLHFRRGAGECQVSYTQSSEAGLELYLYGLEGIGVGDAPAMPSLKAFWRAKIMLLVKDLSAKPALREHHAAITSLLQRFMNDTFDRLSIFQCENRFSHFVFTHTDLCPRNVLVSGTPRRVTGIVDFEFAGFFPPLDELIPEYLEYLKEGKGAWPVEMFNDIQKRMEKAGDLSLLAVKDMPVWQEIQCLSALESYIAPWWLAEGGVNGQELELELREAKRHVENAILTLEKAVHESD